MSHTPNLTEWKVCGCVGVKSSLYSLLQELSATCIAMCQRIIHDQLMLFVMVL